MSELSALLTRFATKWISRYPEAAKRISKGQTLALEGHCSPWNATSWRVLSSDKERTYWVEVENGYPKCSCPDYENRPVRCCHIWACALMAKVAEAIEEELPPEPPSISQSNVALGRDCRRPHNQNAKRFNEVITKTL